VSAESLYLLLGRRVAEARSKRSGGAWSQGQLAKACHLTRGSIANIEIGRQRAPLHCTGCASGGKLAFVVTTAGTLGNGLPFGEAFILSPGGASTFRAKRFAVAKPAL